MHPEDAVSDRSTPPRRTADERAPRIATAFWLFASAAAHALIVVASLSPRLPEHAQSMRESRVWMEAAAPQPPPEPPLPPPPPPRPHRIAPARAAERAAEKPATTPEPAAAPAAPQQPAAQSALGPSIAAGEGTLAIAAASGAPGGQGRGDGAPGGGEPGGAEPERKQGAAQLSIWLAPDALEHMALVRPAIALLMSVPGYRDVLRGSGIDPFSDLQRLHIRVAGLAPERLAIAGVHVGGERALIDVAARVAAMRKREPVWRGDSDLRATSWVDGSGVDRGLAVHGGAFVIAARAAMPALLGANGAARQVASLSQLRERAVMALAIEDAARYLPALQVCALQALRLSVEEGGGGYRISLLAHYRAASAAGRSAACLRALPQTAAPLASLVQWLVQATVAPGSFTTRLNKEVKNEDVEELLAELAWALRSA